MMPGAPGALHLAGVMTLTTFLWFLGKKRDATTELSLCAQALCLAFVGVILKALWGTYLKYLEHKSKKTT